MASRKNRQIILKESEIRKIKKEVTNSAVRDAFVLLFTVLHDKHGFGSKRLNEVVKEVTELAGIINDPKCGVSIDKLNDVLRNELGVNVMG